MKKEKIVKKSKFSILLSVVIILMISIVIFLFLLKSKKIIKPKGSKKYIPIVKTIIPNKENVKIVVESYGSVKVRNSYPIKSRVSGEVVYLHRNFESGGIVKKGEIILRIDPVDYELLLKNSEEMLKLKSELLKMAQLEKKNSEDSLLIEEKNYKLAKIDLERYRKMLKKRTISKQIYDKSLITYQKSETIIQNYKNQLSLLDNKIAQGKINVELAKIALEKVKLDLERTIIKSPITGKFSKRNVELHQFIQTGLTLGVVFDLENLEIETGISGEDFTWLSSKQKDNVSVEFIIPKIKKTFHATISRVGESLKNDTRTYSIYVDIKNNFEENDEFSLILPGSFCKLKFIGKNVKDVYKLPFVTLSHGEIEIIRDNKLKRLPVKVIKNEGDFYIVSASFIQGDKIVETFVNTLVEGQLLRDDKGGK